MRTSGRGRMSNGSSTPGSKGYKGRCHDVEQGRRLYSGFSSSERSGYQITSLHVE